jgi:hypothetical protein
MKNSFTLLRVSIAAAILLVSSTGVVSAGEAPSFLQVGKSYSVISSSAEYRFTLLEIDKGGWIKAVLQQRHNVAWINTNAVLVITPYPFQGAHAPR